MVRGASAGAAAAKGWEEVGVRLRHRLREAGGGQDHGHRLAGEVPPVADQGGRRQGRCPRDSVTVSRDKSKITVTSEWRPSPSVLWVKVAQEISLTQVEKQRLPVLGLQAPAHNNETD
ncbi:hypothetical protein B296_00004732 [Ensete ventricosum]|uniref:Uncharacterized protein n=1 Tax=Ensete ventricosum TaxID=4639 RepID=A0A427AFD2_ENSVE|nr:hypothetical protein B296_00004732 [Ensete ventricosum]